MKALFPIALLALAACSDGPEPEAAQPSATATAEAPVPIPTPGATSADAASLTTIAGEYRVAGVGGQDINLPYGITASITADRIHLSADCVNIEWGYTMDADGSLSTARVPTEGCARGLNEIEEALVEAFDGAERVTRDASNGYEFSGSGPTVILFTQ